ncbi:thialysine N-epsilon-acetyltransferase-like [Ambystoma mexicanum]|uniref:thialysine N-epsilon-acetyltransferase-like n=1 Tax=Ambystoma mexicanum TaxID=8296 RepID=UPI0037E949F8
MSVTAGMEFKVRPAGDGDCIDIMRMIRELAEFERLPEQVHITEEVLKRDGFSGNPFYKCFVAELCPGCKSKEGFTVVGYALYFFTYSTWTGRAVHLEDIYVMPEFRGNGMGKKLISKVAEVCLELGCCRLQLTVLDWNQPAREFYMKNGAVNLTTSEGWHMLRFQGEVLEQLAKN